MKANFVNGKCVDTSDCTTRNCLNGICISKRNINQ